MARKERRKIPRDGQSRGTALRREISQLKRQSEEILLRMDEILRDLEAIDSKTTGAIRFARPKK